MFWDTYLKLCESEGKKPQPVALEMGIKSGSVTKWKNGAMPSLENLQKISSHFGVTIDYLIYGEHRFAKTAEEEDIELLDLFHKLDPKERRDFIGAIRIQLMMDGAEKKSETLQEKANALSGTRAG